MNFKNKASDRLKIRAQGTQSEFILRLNMAVHKPVNGIANKT